MNPSLSPNPESRAAPGRVSPLAVIALVLAVVPCCPLASMMGATLGIVAMKNIRLSGGRLTGRRAAMAAVIIGISISILSTVLFTTLPPYVDREMRTTIVASIEGTVRACADGQVVAAAGYWAKLVSDAPSADSLQRFGSLTRERYGRLNRFQITSMVTNNGLFSQQIEIAGVFSFERGERTGSAKFQLQPGEGVAWPSFWIRNVKIDDAERGPIQLPEP